MGIIGKIWHKVDFYIGQNIICEQYPMLTSISRFLHKADGTIGVVYMLHHITEKNPNGIPTNEDLKVSPRFLEDIILKYKKRGFTFVSLDQLANIISSEEKSERPFVAFTIDDGYLDNYTHALPVFERQQVPFAIFVASDFIEQKAILWWDILEDLILKNDTLKIGSNEYRCHTFQEKWDVFRILREIILLFDPAKLKTALESMFARYNIDLYEPIRHQAMTWEQVKELSNHPLCTIGGHTVSHCVLNQLSKDDFRKEVGNNIRKIESVTGKPVQHFAYPYGSPNEIGEREYQLISEFGFKTVFSSYGGCITNENRHQITHLPRVYLHER
ncbi:MAG: polysaccharide deacetylase family protein [Bacilli bacterium]|nr:polysaccharide deacetylase family protein [Prevotella sp.]MBR0440139.1 polysaccharide deacetylase family protein [Bacilli bacterium]